MGQLVASAFSLPRRSISILLVYGILACTLVLLQTWSFDIGFLGLYESQHERSSSELSFETNNYLDELIRNHDLSPRVEWAAWNILSTQSQEKWSPLTRVPRRFQPQRLGLFDQRGRHPSTQTAFRTLALPSPRGWRPGQFNASRYLFGVSTTYARLMADDRAMLKNWQWWLTDGRQRGSGAHMVIMLGGADDQQMQKVEGVLEELAIPAMVYNAGEVLPAATLYAQLAGELHAYGSALSAVGLGKAWFVLMDDTVFFPSLSYLDETLGAHDARDRVYIGVPSERRLPSTTTTTTTSGGGGVVILSRRGLASYLALSCAEMEASSRGASSSSSSRSGRQQWTASLHECLTARGRLPMRALPGGLYSHAAADDDDLESGARPLALRNRAPGRDHLDTASAYLVADTCGEACFAQRFLFRDGWVLVNGVSVSQYQRPARRGGDGGDGDGGGGARNVWRLLESSVDDYGAVWQAYVKRDVRAPTGAKVEPLDSVIILVWNESKRG